MYKTKMIDTFRENIDGHGLIDSLTSNRVVHGTLLDRRNEAAKAINAYDSNQQEIAELNLTIMRMKHTLEVIASNPDWNDHHCRAMKLLEEYSEHNKLREQKS